MPSRVNDPEPQRLATLHGRADRGAEPLRGLRRHVTHSGGRRRGGTADVAAVGAAGWGLAASPGPAPAATANRSADGRGGLPGFGGPIGYDVSD